MTGLQFADYVAAVACLTTSSIEAARYSRTKRAFWAFTCAAMGFVFTAVAFN